MKSVLKKLKSYYMEFKVVDMDFASLYHLHISSVRILKLIKILKIINNEKLSLPIKPIF